MVINVKISVKSIITGIIALCIVIAGICAARWIYTTVNGDKAGGDTSSQGENEFVILTVVTTFAASDGNTLNYKNAYSEWENLSGNSIYDKSTVSDDSFKVRILTDFETNSEPDILFFFSGVDADPFIEAGKVVSIEEIRSVYPEYASNMNDAVIPVSEVDGRAYAVPVNGYWEAMYINTEIFEQAGIEIPDENYTWEQFREDCEAIKHAGFVPIAAALGNIPHYWWELCVFNNAAKDNHLTLPQGIEDQAGQAWTKGMEDIKELYDAGYFPSNTLSATDDETFSLFMAGKAAFLVDGSWKVGSIVSACQTNPDDKETLDEEMLSKFDVIRFPAKEENKDNRLIGGLSMGYYITGKAWADPVKRQAAVDFVMHMTSNKVVTQFSRHTTNALRDMELDDVDITTLNSLEQKAREMLTESTSLTGAVQDRLKEDAKSIIFEGIPNVLNGSKDAAEILEEGLRYIK